VEQGYKYPKCRGNGVASIIYLTQKIETNASRLVLFVMFIFNVTEMLDFSTELERINGMPHT